MRLRKKLLLLLLVLSVVPIAVVRIVDSRSLIRLGDAVAAEARSQLEAEVQRGLERTVASFTRIIEEEERLVLALLRQQADAVERRLIPSFPDSAAPVFTLNDFNDRPETIPYLHPSDRHLRPGDDGGLVPVEVSYATQVVIRLPGLARERLGGVRDTQRVIRQMAGLTEDYRKVHAGFPDAIFWQFTALRHGLHLSYPGKGGYPADFNPFERDWYLRAEANRDANWTPPVPDSVTGRTMLTASMPVYAPDGEFAGVTAIDIPLDRVLERQRLGEAWGADATVSMVRAVNVEAVEARYPVQLRGTGDVVAVFASSDGEMNPLRVDASFEFQRVGFDNPDDERAVFASITNQEAGTRNAMVGGRPMKLAWAQLNDEFSAAMLVMAPLDRLDAGGAALQAEIGRETILALVGSGVIVGLTVVIVIAAALRGARTVTQPVVDLAQAASRVADGDLDAHVDLAKETRKDELGDMARAFNDMVPKLRDRLHMRASLDLAMEVQQALLPQAPPTLPGFDIAGRSDYCDETGGDYFDFLEIDRLDQRHLGVALGDVTGHGIAAALLMCTGRALLRSRASVDGSLADLFGVVNAHLAESGFHGRFMTLFYLMIESDPLHLRWVSAGHDPAIVYDPDADAFTELAGEDLPLGVEESWDFTEKSTDTLPDRAIVVLGTDGIWEARDAADDMYGKDRLNAVIRAHHAEDADTIAQHILDDVTAFRGEREQLDDITLVVIKRVLS